MGVLERFNDDKVVGGEVAFSLTMTDGMPNDPELRSEDGMLHGITEGSIKGVTMANSASILSMQTSISIASAKPSFEIQAPREAP